MSCATWCSKASASSVSNPSATSSSGSSSKSPGESSDEHSDPLAVGRPRTLERRARGAPALGARGAHQEPEPRLDPRAQAERSAVAHAGDPRGRHRHDHAPDRLDRRRAERDRRARADRHPRLPHLLLAGVFDRDRDRKSTRLNSSHSQISYAVFCLKKKTPQATFPPMSRGDWPPAETAEESEIG